MTVTDDRLGIALGLPEGYAVVPQEPDEEGFAPLVLAPEPWPEDHGFRPSVVLVASPPADPAPSVRAAGSEAVAAALAMPDSRVLAYDLWPLPDGSVARRVVFAYLAGDTAVSVAQHVLVHHGRTVSITFSADTDRWLRVQRDLAQALDGLALTDGSDA